MMMMCKQRVKNYNVSRQLCRKYFFVSDTNNCGTVDWCIADVAPFLLLQIVESKWFFLVLCERLSTNLVFHLKAVAV